MIYYCFSFPEGLHEYCIIDTLYLEFDQTHWGSIRGVMLNRGEGAKSRTYSRRIFVGHL